MAAKPCKGELLTGRQQAEANGHADETNMQPRQRKGAGGKHKTLGENPRASHGQQAATESELGS